MNRDALLKKIAVQGIEATSFDEMVVLACAFWHEGFVPNLDNIKHLDAEELKVAGYLVEIFSTFNCVDDSKAKSLQAFANHIKQHILPQPDKDNPDEIAAEWGLKENLDQHLGKLLYYQTRHYKHEK